MDAYLSNNTLIQDIYSPCEGKVEEWNSKIEEKFGKLKRFEKGIITIKPSSSILRAPCSGLVTGAYYNTLYIKCDSGFELTLRIKRSKILVDQKTIPLVEEGMRIECHQPIYDLGKKAFHRDCLIGLLFEEGGIHLTDNVFWYDSNSVLDILVKNKEKVTYRDKLALLASELKKRHLEKIKEFNLTEIVSSKNNLYLTKDFEDILEKIN